MLIYKKVLHFWTLILNARTWAHTQLVREHSATQSLQLAKPLWTDPGQKSGISVRELISTFKKKAQEGNELSNILPKSSHTRKKPPQPPTIIYLLCILFFVFMLPFVTPLLPFLCRFGVKWFYN